MPRSETRAWWADVAHVRASIERRREREARDADRAARRAAGPEQGRARLTVVNGHGNRDHGSRSDEMGDARAALLPASGTDLDRSGRGRRGRFSRPEASRRLDRSDDRVRFAPAAGAAAHRELDRAFDFPSVTDRSSPGGLDDRTDFAPTTYESFAAEFDHGVHPALSTYESRPGEFDDVSRAPGRPRGRSDGPRPLAAPAPRRRTIEITGRTVGAPSLPRLVEIDRRRPARRPVERVGPRPDRVAMWAVILGFFLILVAFTSASHAATPASARSTSPSVARAQAAKVPAAVAAPRIVAPATR